MPKPAYPVPRFFENFFQKIFATTRTFFVTKFLIHTKINYDFFLKVPEIFQKKIFPEKSYEIAAKYVFLKLEILTKKFAIRAGKVVELKIIKKI